MLFWKVGKTPNKQTKTNYIALKRDTTHKVCCFSFPCTNNYQRGFQAFKSHTLVPFLSHTIALKGLVLKLHVYWVRRICLCVSKSYITLRGKKTLKCGPATRTQTRLFFNSMRFSAFIWCPHFQQLGFMQKNIKCHRAYNKNKIKS